MPFSNFSVTFIICKKQKNYWKTSRVCTVKRYKTNFYFSSMPRKYAESIKQRLSGNDGKYILFSGVYDDPFELLEEMAEREDTFRDQDELVDYRFVEEHDGGYVDFRGVRKMEEKYHRILVPLVVLTRALRASLTHY